MEAMGFRVFVPDDLYIQKGYLAGPDEHRAELLNRLFNDDSIKAIICARGGFGSIRILESLDLDAIRNHPKVFIGFSDITALLSVLADGCGVAAFHGPMAASLAKADDMTKQSLFSAMTSDRPISVSAPQGDVLKPGRASGKIAGGNLATLCHLLGTPFAPNLNGRILVLEDIGEPAYKIDRMLTQMKMAGCFDGLSGLALGAFENCCPPESVRKIVLNVFKNIDIPILSGFDIGHGARNLTIPIGMAATLDTKLKTLACHK